MKKIPLKHKKQFLSVLVDDEDFDCLNKFRWYFGGRYTFRLENNKFGKTISMHRQIMDVKKGQYVDHINGNKLDNRRENLRICSFAQNRMNIGKLKSKNITSVYKGVEKKAKSWIARIKFKKVNYYIGSFKTEHHAAMAYDLWAKDLFGEFARLNFVVA